MAKSLKEALLEKFSDLQELGIAPTAAPIEEEGPSIVVEAGPEGRREAGGRRQRSNRFNDYDDEPRRGDEPIRPRSRPRRGERSDRPGGGDRGRRPERSPLGERGVVGDAAPAPERPSAPTGRPAPTGPRFGDRPPVGNRPPGGPRSGPPRFGGPGNAGPQQSGVTDRLRQRAEQRRREGEHREQLQRLLASATGGEMDEAALDKFLADLAVEVGALPPLERVVEAVELANTAEPTKVGDQVRQLYRRPRPRPAGLPGA